MKPYKKTVELLLKDEHKAQCKNFANWARKEFWKEDIMRILFYDEKMFDLDGIYNSQNDRIWAVNRVEANWRGGKKQQRKFPQKVMVWLAVCSESVAALCSVCKRHSGSSPLHQGSTTCCSRIRKQ